MEGSSAFTACTLGRNNTDIIEAVVEELRRNPVIVGGSGGSPAQIMLAVKIAERLPGSLNRVLFGLGGSDANETAFKIALQYWKIKKRATKYKIISRWGSYHGGLYGSGGATGITSKRVPFEPFPAGFIHTNPPYCYECAWKMSYPECDLYCAEDLRRVVVNEDPETIAAWIGDLVPAALGPFPSPPGYPERVRQICDEYDILMIVDEIVTGWGRMGAWTASEYYGITPDMITLAKGLSSLYQPLSATVVKEEIADVFTGENVLPHVMTVQGYAPGCAAGLAVIEYIERENILEQVREKSRWLQSEFEKMEKDFRCVGATHCLGLYLGVEIVANKETRERIPDFKRVAKVIKEVGIKRGVTLHASQGHYPFSPALTATKEELQHMVDTLREAFAEVDRQFL
jgi:adenosylmethionine-8-amino-7-oxononanoate aminotransferase